MSRRANLGVLLGAVALTACGDGADRSRTGPDTIVGTPPAATASAAPGQSPAPATTVTPTPSDDEGGDEQGNRVGVQFDVSGRRISPRRIELPAFLGLAVALRNSGEEAVSVTLDGRRLEKVPPLAEQVVEVDGLRPGEHTLATGSGGRATIVAVRAGG